MSKKYVITGYREYGDQADVRKKLKNLVVFGEDMMQISDGYHTMDELYDHRITLFIALCRTLKKGADNSYAKFFPFPWRSKRHNDGKLCFETGTQFILGFETEDGQISYHIPIERWEETNFAETLEVAPEWDGHTSADVLERLKAL